MLGDYGFYTKKYGLKNFLKEWNIEGEYISEGSDKVKLNIFEDLKEEDSQW